MITLEHAHGKVVLAAKNTSQFVLPMEIHTIIYVSSDARTVGAMHWDSMHWGSAMTAHAILATAQMWTTQSVPKMTRPTRTLVSYDVKTTPVPALSCRH